jgi:hypothetical protein
VSRPRRWPNTAHWQRVEAAFRETDGSRWRTAAAAALGIDRGQLRTAVDRTMTHDELCALENSTMAAMNDCGRRLADRIDRLRQMHGDFDEARYRRIRSKFAEAADITLDEMITGHAAEDSIRAQFGSRIQAEDAKDAMVFA